MTAIGWRTACIDAAALRQNAAAAVAMTGELLKPDLRADGYGLGAARIARLLEGVGLAASTDPHARALCEPLYGLAPCCRPVVRLSGRLVAVKAVAAGHGVSYGATYRTARPTRLGLVALGYADGVVRAASNAAPVLVAGERRRIAGLVAMDQFVLDLDDLSARPGDEVVLFGDPERGEPSILEWAASTGWPAAALLCGLGPRVRRDVRCRRR